MLDLLTVPTATKGKQKGRILPLFYRMNTLSASHQSQRWLHSFWTTELCSKEPWQEHRLSCSAIPPPHLTAELPFLAAHCNGWRRGHAALLMKFRVVSERPWQPRKGCLQIFVLFYDRLPRALQHFVPFLLFVRLTAPRPISTAAARFVSQQLPCPASIFEQIRASPAVLRALVCPPSTHLRGPDVVVQVRQLQHPAERRRHRRRAAVRRGSRRVGRELRCCRKSAMPHCRQAKRVIVKRAKERACVESCGFCGAGFGVGAQLGASKDAVSFPWVDTVV